MKFQTFLSIPLLLQAAHASTASYDDFSSGDLSGGTGWSGNWQDGTVLSSTDPDNIFSTEALQLDQNGFSTRQFDVDNTQDYNIQFTLGLSEASGGNQEYGFRFFHEAQNDNVFSIIWKSDNVQNAPAGQLTFVGGTNGSQSFSISDPNWNLDTNLSTVDDFTYTFDIDVMPIESNPNSGSYSGTYVATVTRSDNVSFTTSALDWVAQNPLSSGNFDAFTFLNTSDSLNVQIDEISVSSVPEPSVVLLLNGLLGTLVLRRNRN